MGTLLRSCPSFNFKFSYITHMKCILWEAPTTDEEMNPKEDSESAKDLATQ